jgi:hypothetical protein
MEINQNQQKQATDPGDVILEVQHLKKVFGTRESFLQPLMTSAFPLDVVSASGS